jgi:hypothetical protein
VKLLKITTFFALAAAALTVPAGAIVQAPGADSGGVSDCRDLQHEQAEWLREG